MFPQPLLRARSTCLLLSAESTSDSHEVHWFTPGQSSLIPKRWRDDKRPTFLYPKEDVTLYNYAKRSDRTWRPQLQWVDTTPAKQADLHWQQRGIDWREIEKPMIDLAFDKPEAIPLFLKDLIIKGYRDVMSAEWLKKAIYWVHEARYWRTIGVYHPFYHKHCLRVHVWRYGIQSTQSEAIRKGPLVGAPLFTTPMVDAVYDLEKAYRRAELGLAPNYKWEKWSPVGFNDGRPNDWLPRLPSMKWDPDPDGVMLNYEELEFLTQAPENAENPLAVHNEMKKRYHKFIYSESNEYAGCFSVHISPGKLQLKDFAQYFPEVEIPYDNLRDMAYLVAYHETNSGSAQITSIDLAHFKENILPKLREENDAKVEAIRLFYNCSSEIQWVRQYIEEKTGLADFMHTPDKDLTRVIENLLEEMHRIVETYPWGKALASCTTFGEYRSVAGEVAYAVAMRIQDAGIDRRREEWNNRFTGEGKEEQQLDFMLQKMSQRSNVAAETNVYGTEFDREKEPIGRDTQRRVMYSDKQTGGKRKEWKRKSDKPIDIDRSLMLTRLK